MKRLFVLLLTSIIITSCSHKEETSELEVEFLVTSPLQLDTTINTEYVGQIRFTNHIKFRYLEKGVLTKQKQMVAKVNVYRALGGGWN